MLENYVKKCKGSPPPMRGKASYSHHIARSLRITPAYAGKRETLIDEKFVK